jgi:hypothetical protein
MVLQYEESFPRDWRDKQDIDFDTSGTISIVIGGEDDDE